MDPLEQGSTRNNTYTYKEKVQKQDDNVDYFADLHKIEQGPRQDRVMRQEEML